MKQKETEMVELAKRVMLEIGFLYDTNVAIRVGFTSKEDQISEVESDKNHPKYQEYIDSLKSYWSFGFDPDPEIGIERNNWHLSIDDETGEPYYIRHRQAGFKIEKSTNGKYTAINDWIQGHD